MRIIQITDLHLPAQKGDLVEGVDTIQVFENLLTHLKQQDADLLVMTGDVSSLEENNFCFNLLKKSLDQLSYPSVIMRGNHDRGPIFKKVFSKSAVTGLKIVEPNDDFSLLFFDTASEEPNIRHLKKIEERLLTTDKTHYLFTHYPPILVNHPSYDGKHRLKWQELFFKTILKSKKPLYVFFGHIHYELQMSMGQLRLYSAPSTTVPVIPGVKYDVPDKRGVCYRNICITSDRCEVSIRYTGDA